MHTLRFSGRDHRFFPIHFLALSIFVQPEKSNQNFITANRMHKKEKLRLVEQRNHRAKGSKETRRHSYASAASARSSARSRSTSIMAIRRATCTHSEKSLVWVCSLPLEAKRALKMQNHLVIFSVGILSNELSFGQLLFECSNTFVILEGTLFETFATTWSWKRRKKYGLVNQISKQIKEEEKEEFSR